MLYKAAVTFEFQNAPPETFRGEFAATGPQTAASRAVRAARKAFPKRQPSSLVVLLEPMRDATGG